MESSIILSSSSSSEIYPENTATNFRCRLPSLANNAYNYSSSSSFSSSQQTLIALQTLSLSENFGNIDASVYDSEEHVLLFLRPKRPPLRQPMSAPPPPPQTPLEQIIERGEAMPLMCVKVGETHHSADTLAAKLNREAHRQLAALAAATGDTVEDKIAFVVDYQEGGKEKLMIRLGVDYILLLREEFASFLMTEEQLNHMPRITINRGGGCIAGSGGGKFVKIATPLSVAVSSDLFFFITCERPISLAAKAYPDLIKVRIDRMTHYLSGTTTIQDLCYIPVHPYLLDHSPLFHVAGRKEYFPVSEPVLTELCVSLHDEKDRLLRLRGSGGGVGGTVVRLQLKTEDMASSSAAGREHIVRLSSHESLHVHADNAPGDFMIQLQGRLLPQDEGSHHHHPMLQQQQQWYCALSSIFLPGEIDYWGMLMTTAAASRTLYVDILGGRQFNRVHLNVQGTEINTTAQFVEHVNRLLETANFALLEDGSGQLAVRVAQLDRGELQLQFGSRKVLRLGALLRFILHRSDTTGGSLERIVGQRGENVRLGNLNLSRLHPHVAQLSLNCVVPSVLGEGWSTVLDLVKLAAPMGSTEDENLGVQNVSRYQVQHHSFVPLATTELQSLHFQLKTLAGDVILFKKKNAATLLTIVFQRAFAPLSYY